MQCLFFDLVWSICTCVRENWALLRTVRSSPLFNGPAAPTVMPNHEMKREISQQSHFQCCKTPVSESRVKPSLTLYCIFLQILINISHIFSTEVMEQRLLRQTLIFPLGTVYQLKANDPHVTDKGCALQKNVNLNINQKNSYLCGWVENMKCITYFKT